MHPARAPLLTAAVAFAAAAGGCGADDVRAVREIEFRPPAEVAKAGQPAPAPPLPPVAPRPRAGTGPLPAALRRSVAVGRPNAGRLVRGVPMPPDGPDWVTWDPILKRTPNRAWRRYGTDTLVAFVRSVLAGYRRAHPDAPRALVGDLSLPRGGVFDRRYGGLGHASHQNGLDVDIYFPRRDRRLVAPRSARDVDRRLAQAMVDAFVAAGARFAFVGPRVGLTGPPAVVQVIPHHDDHLHVRVRPPRSRAGRG